MSKITFKCDKCEHEWLEEVMEDVVVVSLLLNLYDDGFADYGDQANNGGSVVRYQCSSCGDPVLNSSGEAVSDPAELHQVLDSRIAR